MMLTVKDNDSDFTFEQKRGETIIIFHSFILGLIDRNEAQQNILPTTKRSASKTEDEQAVPKRRSVRERIKPDRYTYNLDVNVDLHSEN